MTSALLQLEHRNVSRNVMAGLVPASRLERHLNPKRDHRVARPPRGCVTTNGAYRRPFLLPAQARSPAITARDSRMASLDNISIAILLGSLLVLAGILSSLIALRFGAPLLLVFLLVGVLAGDGGPGGIAFSDVRSTYTVGSIALALILFDGGLRMRFATFRSVLAPSVMLATAGVLVTMLLTAPFAKLVLGIGWVQALLVGAVVA